MANPIAVVTTVKSEDRESIESEARVESLEQRYDVCRRAPPSALVRISLTGDDGEEQIILAGSDVSTAVRSEEAGIGASSVAMIPAVRAALMERQRAFRTAPGLVADG